MPALLATRFNADLTAENQALIAAGEAPQLAITAIMRKLLILADARLGDCPTWDPKLA
jgi:transposase